LLQQYFTHLGMSTSRKLLAFLLNQLGRKSYDSSHSASFYKRDRGCE